MPRWASWLLLAILLLAQDTGVWPVRLSATDSNGSVTSTIGHSQLIGIRIGEARKPGPAAHFFDDPDAVHGFDEWQDVCFDDIPTLPDDVPPSDEPDDWWPDSYTADNDDPPTGTAAASALPLAADAQVNDGAPPSSCFDGIPLSHEEDWRKVEGAVRLKHGASNKQRTTAATDVADVPAVAWTPQPPFTAAEKYVGFFPGFVYT